jgi:hypothetical protein
MKDEHSTQKGLNISTLKFNPFRVAILISSLSTGFTGGYSNFIPSG